MNGPMDINCDLGEGIGRDADIMPYLDSCSIACGGHAGDRETMVDTLRLAREHEVRVGAHPSFEDRKNFGRTEMYVPPEQLRSQLIHQIAELSVLAKLEDVELAHVKAHGALYNMSARSADLASLLIDVVDFFNEDLILYVPFGSLLFRKAREAGIPFMVEAFADRNYDDDFRLVPRSEPNAVITDPELVKERVERLLGEQQMISANGNVRKVEVDTLCIHGDNPRAVEIARELRSLNLRYS